LNEQVAGKRWNGNLRRTVIGSVLSALVVAAFTGGYIWRGWQAIARPDPFTGSQGAALEARIADLERWRDELEGR
jgi:hypothetical protein